MAELQIRQLAATDSIDELTALIHRAFALLGSMGLNYTAVESIPEVTARRIASGECYVALMDGRIVGTVTLTGPAPRSSCLWYRKPEVAAAHQLAVEPDFQRRGVGAALMAHVEQRAAAQGFRELAIDTAEPAKHLIEFYTRFGYEWVEFGQWRGKTYRSVIMSKKLTSGG